MKNNSCTPINPKKYSCHGRQNIHTRNLITKKNSRVSKILLPPTPAPPPPPAPYNFSNGPSLTSEKQKYKQKRIKPPSTDDKGVV